MAGYRIELSRSAQKDLDKLDGKTLRRVTRAIDSLISNPRPRGTRKLVGSEDDCRIRVGEFRVVYEVDDEDLAVIVRYIRHRSEAYR